MFFKKSSSFPGVLDIAVIVTCIIIGGVTMILISTATQAKISKGYASGNLFYFQHYLEEHGADNISWQAIHKEINNSKLDYYEIYLKFQLRGLNYSAMTTYSTIDGCNDYVELTVKKDGSNYYFLAEDLMPEDSCFAADIEGSFWTSKRMLAVMKQLVEGKYDSDIYNKHICPFKGMDITHRDVVDSVVQKAHLPNK